MLADVIGGDPNAKNSLTALMDQLDFASLQEKAYTSNDNNDDDYAYFQWNQNLCGGGSKTKYMIWRVIHELANLCILCNSTKEVNAYIHIHKVLY